MPMRLVVGTWKLTKHPICSFDNSFQYFDVYYYAIYSPNLKFTVINPICVSGVESVAICIFSRGQAGSDQARV
jgi:hypothetical protein